MIILAAAALLANGTPALAQESSAGQPAAIVVQGTRDMRRPATDYIDKILPPTFDAEIGRFEDPICVATVGLPEKLKAEVIGRVAEVGSASGIEVAGPGCTPNLFVIVVDDKKAMIQGMEQKHASYLYGVSAPARRQLENAPGPVAAWQISDVIGADGIPLRVDGDGFPRLFTTTPPSRLTSTTRKRLLASVVVIESKALVNVSTRQLADFALVRALAPIQSKMREAPDSSVLSLFSGEARPEDAPQSVTWWDLAFLRALADTRSDILPSAQRHEIRDKMVAEIAKLPVAQR